MTDINTLLAAADSAAIRVHSLKSQDAIRARIAALRIELSELEGKVSGTDEDIAAAAADYETAVADLVAHGVTREKVDAMVLTRIDFLKENGLLVASNVDVSTPAVVKVEKAIVAPAKMHENTAPAAAAESDPAATVVNELAPAPASGDDDAAVIAASDAQDTVVTDDPQIEVAKVNEERPIEPEPEVAKAAPVARPTPSNSMSRTRRPSAVVTEPTAAAPSSKAAEAVVTVESPSTDTSSVGQLVDQVFGADVTDDVQDDPKVDFLTGEPIVASENSGAEEKLAPEVAAAPEVEPEPEPDPEPEAAPEAEPEVDLNALPAFLR